MNREDISDKKEKEEFENIFENDISKEEFKVSELKLKELIDKMNDIFSMAYCESRENARLLCSSYQEDIDPIFLCSTFCDAVEIHITHAVMDLVEFMNVNKKFIGDCCVNSPISMAYQAICILNEVQDMIESQLFNKNTKKGYRISVDTGKVQKKTWRSHKEQK